MWYNETQYNKKGDGASWTHCPEVVTGFQNFISATGYLETDTRSGSAAECGNAG